MIGTRHRGAHGQPIRWPGGRLVTHINYDLKNRRVKFFLPYPLDNLRFLPYNTYMLPDLPILSSKRVMLEIALYLEGSGDTVEDILNRNQITPEDLKILVANPIFKADLARVREEVRENGLTFRVKARTMAEELLKTTWDITQDNSTSPAVKADLIKACVEWGDLKPKSKENAGVGAGGVRIVFNFADLGGPNASSRIKNHEIVGISEVLATSE